jgi:hypothetical protein
VLSRKISIEDDEKKHCVIVQVINRPNFSYPSSGSPFICGILSCPGDVESRVDFHHPSVQYFIFIIDGAFANIEWGIIKTQIFFYFPRIYGIIGNYWFHVEKLKKNWYFCILGHSNISENKFEAKKIEILELKIWLSMSY